MSREAQRSMFAINIYLSMFVGKYQWQIMRSLGLQDDEIKNFADVNYWLQYFPPKTEADLRVRNL